MGATCATWPYQCAENKHCNLNTPAGAGVFISLGVLNLTIFNDEAYSTFKSIFHKALNLFYLCAILN